MCLLTAAVRFVYIGSLLQGDWSPRAEAAAAEELEVSCCLSLSVGQQLWFTDSTASLRLTHSLLVPRCLRVDTFTHHTAAAGRDRIGKIHFLSLNWKFLECSVCFSIFSILHFISVVHKYCELQCNLKIYVKRFYWLVVLSRMKYVPHTTRANGVVVTD